MIVAIMKDNWYIFLNIVTRKVKTADWADANYQYENLSQDI